MIKEVYCSKEVSILLKEKGFNEKCRGGYHYEFDDNDNPIVMLEEWTAQPYNNDFVDEGFLCSAPTHQMAIKWLREEKNILIYVYPVIVLPVKDDYTFYWRWDGKKKIHYAPHIGDKHNYETFEDAVEAALKYCLENVI